MSAVLPLADLTVVVTGNLPGLDRDQAKAAVIALGGKPSGSVSGKTDLVVMGEGAGLSKTAKVRQHSIPVLTGDAFAALAADPGSWDGAPVGAPLAEPEQAAPVEPVRVGAHTASLAAVFPQGIPEYRMWCRCGHRWLGASSHERTLGCPKDPARASGAAAPA